MKEEVLIVGSGPTGLVLALWLTKLGIPLRIIDKNSGQGQTSRAMALHARTLEFYQQIGIAEEVIAHGIIIEKINLWKNHRHLTTIPLHSIGKGFSPFPFVLSFPQDEHEKLLINHLSQAGIEVERNTELINLSQDEKKVTAILKNNNKTETCEVQFLLGCDGAKSTVRHALNIDFPGGMYSQLYYVADVLAQKELEKNEIHVNLIENEFTIIFPIRNSHSLRLIGIVPKECENKKNIEFNDVKSNAIRNTDLTIEKVNWFSTYHSHHRVAEHFKNGRVFLLGDAAHIHSPAGGQGMNTGIGDAINLSWKIANVIKKHAALSLLDSYEPERIAFARRLVATTDKAFQAITSIGVIGRLVRDIFFPYIFPFMMRFNFFKKFLFLTVSQIKINYRHSELSKGRAGRIRSGDRLPWLQQIDNFKPLTSLNWQVHIYGQATEEFKESMTRLDLELYEFSWDKSFDQTGIKENAVYLIRPDGYIGFVSEEQDYAAIEKYFYLKED